ncbi:Glyceraldehyde-3-phosphate dehydrogenase [Microtus ochrogaster]|uniref:glyceraldehyde-3-phosphate dehydrogenase (phosphorylating) n=1 Tax=Microtus ochrogaster TaxID=79684 RepID=A0A8J6L1Y5_MICOH|nr:Glyceraldehyde-3-phosphate dehydrogenase [Microtus ochrogaster]
MVKVRMNRFSCIAHLVTRASFNSGKVDVGHYPFIALHYMVYMFQCDSSHGKFNVTVKAEHHPCIHWYLSSMGRPSPSSRSEILPTSNGMMMVPRSSDVAFHVPIPNVSFVDLTCCLEKAAKNDDIKKVVKQALRHWRTLGYTEDQVVS